MIESQPGGKRERLAVIALLGHRQDDSLPDTNVPEQCFAESLIGLRIRLLLARLHKIEQAVESQVLHRHHFANSMRMSRCTCRSGGNLLAF